MLVMKAPASRDRGQRTVRCNESQASILRKVGWTEVEPDGVAVDAKSPAEEVANYYLDEMERSASGSPPDIVIEPEPVTDPDTVRVSKPKRKYHRRTVNVEPDGKVNYSIKPPKRRYRRRDMTAED